MTTLYTFRELGAVTLTTQGTLKSWSLDACANHDLAKSDQIVRSVINMEALVPFRSKADNDSNITEKVLEGFRKRKRAAYNYL
jgi:hypothetical protein